MGADGHANPDLAGAFGDAHQHDVHDANATDNQRHTGNEGQQNRHRPRRGCRRLGNFQLAAHLEVVVAPGLDMVALTEEISHLLFNNGQYLQVGRLDVDAAQAGLFADQLFDCRCVRHDDTVILVRPAGRRSFGHEDAYDFERHVADADDFSNRILPLVEQLFGRLLPDYRHFGRAADILVGKSLPLGCVPLPDGEIIG